MAESVGKEAKVVAKHGMIYGLANVMDRVVGFLMIPVYTRFLTPADYGTLELIYMTASIISLIIGAGVESAVTRFYFDYQDERSRGKVISTAMLGYGLSAIALVASLIPACGFLADLMLDSPDKSHLFVVSLITLGFSFVMPICMSYLRVRQKSVFVMTIQVSKTAVTLGLNIYFVVVLELSAYGVLLASLIAAALFTVILVVHTLGRTGLTVDFRLLWRMVKFGLPLIPSNLAGFLAQSSDRYFVKEYASLSMTGIYSIGYKFGSMVHQFVTSPFIQIWFPRRFEFFEKDNSEEIYARIFTYFCTVSVFVGLMISLLSKEVIEIMADPAFWSGYKIVPIVVLAHIFFSFHYHFTVGIMIEKKTKHFAYINMATGALSLVLNWILIMRYDMWGAAWASLVSYGFKAWMTYYLSNRLHKIILEWRRLFILFGAGFLIYFVGINVDTGSVWYDLAIKIAIGLTYPILLYVSRMFDEDEVRGIKRIIKTRKLNLD